MLALLIGCGSIGKMHLAFLTSSGYQVFVIDPNINPSEFKYKPDQAIFFKSIDHVKTEFDERSKVARNNLIGVVANWGPDHMTTIKALIELGVTKLLIEKPLVSKLSDLQKLEIYEKQGIILWCNYHIRFSNGMKNLLEFQNRHSIKTPISISVIGGAKCIATNGIHWIDFALQLFKADPISIQSNIQSQFMNPRHKDLVFLEGHISCSFEDSKLLHINYTNKSFSDQIVLVLWEKFIGEIKNGELRIFQAGDPQYYNRPITRTSSFTDEVLRVDFFDLGMENIYQAFLQSTSSLSNLRNANKVLLSALFASKESKMINLKDPQLGSDKDFDWRIS